MRFITQALWMALIAAGLLMANVARSEDARLESYRTTLYAFFQERNCVRCHDGRQRYEVWGPSFAHTDIEKSYRQVQKYIRFDNLGQSYLVQKGGGGHWLADYGFDCKTTEQDLTDVLKKWTSQLQNGGVQPRIRTVALPLPKNLPDKREEFAKMEWDLAELLGEREAVLEMEVHRLRAPQEAIPGAYAFRKPRLRVKGGAVEVRGLSILINGKQNPWRSRYREISQVVPSSAASAPLLSLDVEIVKQDKEADEVQLEFERLQAVADPPCLNLEKFKERVLPLYEARNCRHCHQAGKSAFPFAEKEEELCRQTAAHVNPNRLDRSAWLAAAARGYGDHPLVLTEEDYPEALQALRDWWQNQ